MQRIEITHTTTYTYAASVRFLVHKLHVRPREGHDIRIESSALRISPAYSISWQRDVYGNSVAILNFEESADKLEIISTVMVEHYEGSIVTFELTDQARCFPVAYDEIEQIDLIPCQTPVFPQDKAILDCWLAEIWQPGTAIDSMAFLNLLNEHIANDIAYIVREEPGVQSPATTLNLGRGSCRDMATLFIEACRHQGLATRFVSGYLVSTAAVEDTATTHAWAEVYLQGAGWRGFDSTSGQLVGGDHIAVAVHRHPEAVPPVSGAFVGPPESKPKMSVDVQVRRL